MSADAANIEQWIYTTLAADATINSVVGSRIYADEVTQGAAFPLVLFALIGSIDVLRTLQNGRVNRTLWLVRAVDVGETVQASLKTVAKRFDALLLTSNVTVGDLRIASVQHDQEHVRKDSQDGVPLSYIGSYYYVFSQPV